MNELKIEVKDKSKTLVCREVVSLCSEYLVKITPTLEGKGYLVVRGCLDYNARNAYLGSRSIDDIEATKNFDIVYGVVELETKDSETTGKLNLSYEKLVKTMKFVTPGTVVPLTIELVSVDLSEKGTGEAGKDVYTGNLAGRGELQMLVVEPFDVTVDQNLALFKGDKGDSFGGVTVSTDENGNNIFEFIRYIYDSKGVKTKYNKVVVSRPEWNKIQLKDEWDNVSEMELPTASVDDVKQIQMEVDDTTINFERLKMTYPNAYVDWDNRWPVQDGDSVPAFYRVDDYEVGEGTTAGIGASLIQTRIHPTPDTETVADKFKYATTGTLSAHTHTFTEQRLYRPIGLSLNKPSWSDHKETILDESGNIVFSGYINWSTTPEPEPAITEDYGHLFHFAVGFEFTNEEHMLPDTEVGMVIGKKPTNEDVGYHRFETDYGYLYCKAIKTTIKGPRGLKGDKGAALTIDHTESVEGGTKIVFSDGNEVTLYNGRDGHDGEDGSPGKDGEDGEDGASLVAESKPIDGGTNVTIKDTNGTVQTSFDVMNGVETVILYSYDSIYRAGNISVRETPVESDPIITFGRIMDYADTGRRIVLRFVSRSYGSYRDFLIAGFDKSTSVADRNISFFEISNNYAGIGFGWFIAAHGDDRFSFIVSNCGHFFPENVVQSWETKEDGTYITDFIENLKTEKAKAAIREAGGGGSGGTIAYTDIGYDIANGDYTPLYKQDPRTVGPSAEMFSHDEIDELMKSGGYFAIVVPGTDSSGVNDEVNVRVNKYIFSTHKHDDPDGIITLVGFALTSDDKILLQEKASFDAWSISHPHWDSIEGTPSTFPPSTHTHTIAQVTDLQTTLLTKTSYISNAKPAWYDDIALSTNQKYTRYGARGATVDLYKGPIACVTLKLCGGNPNPQAYGLVVLKGFNPDGSSVDLAVSDVASLPTTSTDAREVVFNFATPVRIDTSLYAIIGVELRNRTNTANIASQFLTLDHTVSEYSTKASNGTWGANAPAIAMGYVVPYYDADDIAKKSDIPDVSGKLEAGTEVGVDQEEWERILEKTEMTGAAGVANILKTLVKAVAGFFPSSIFFLNADGEVVVDSANVNDEGLAVTDGETNDDGTLTVNL